MHDHDPIQPPVSDPNRDLSEFKSLIGETSGEESFSLNDILAEYNGGIRSPKEDADLPYEEVDLPWPGIQDIPAPTQREIDPSEEVTPEQVSQKKVSPKRAAANTADEEEVSPSQADPKPPEHTASEPPSAPVQPEPRASRPFPFQKQFASLRTRLQDLGKQADLYADRVFDSSEAPEPSRSHRKKAKAKAKQGPASEPAPSGQPAETPVSEASEYAESDKVPVSDAEPPVEAASVSEPVQTEAPAPEEPDLLLDLLAFPKAENAGPSSSRTEPHGSFGGMLKKSKGSAKKKKPKKPGKDRTPSDFKKAKSTAPVHPAQAEAEPPVETVSRPEDLDEIIKVLETALQQEREAEANPGKGFVNTLEDDFDFVFPFESKKAPQVESFESPEEESQSESAETSEEEPQDESAEASEEAPQDKSTEASEEEPQDESAEASEEEPQDESVEASEKESQDESAETSEEESQDESAETSEEESQDESAEASEEEPQDESAEASEEEPQDESAEVSEEESQDESAEASEEEPQDESAETSEEESQDESAETSEADGSDQAAAAPGWMAALRTRLKRKPKKLPPPPPDVFPLELSRRYERGLRQMRLRVIALFFLSLVAFIQLFLPILGLRWPFFLGNIAIQSLFSAILLAAGILLSGDILLKSLSRMLQGKMDMDAILLLAALLTLSDSVVLSITQNRDGQIPFCAVILISLLFHLDGAYHKRCGMRLACRTAAASSEPCRVTLEAQEWNGHDTYVKSTGDHTSFGSQMQADDGAQTIYYRFCPLLALACLLLSLLATVGAGHPELLLWGLSASFSVCSCLGATLVYGRSFHLLTRRLSTGGAALAGWPAAVQSRSANKVLLGDLDLFPAGAVSFNGYKVLGEFSLELVIGYTATLIRDSGSGLTKLFYDLLRTEGAVYRKAEDLNYYEGGLSAQIQDSRVLVGSASMIKRMGVTLPLGMNVKNAVLCAIDGELAGIFALRYTMPDISLVSIDMLAQEKIYPVLSTRDFNISPAMLTSRFKLQSARMDFPAVERRWELSDAKHLRSGSLTALLCRDGVLPFSECIAAARRLFRSTRMGAIVNCVGSVIGLLVSCYLISIEAFSSLSPFNMILYLILWLAPVWFLTSGISRY